MRFRLRRPSKPAIVWLGGAIGVATILVIGLIVRHALIAESTHSLPVKLTSRIQGFTPYYFPHAIPQGLELNKNGTSYSNGVLFITLRNESRDQTVNITEQALPKELAANAYPNAIKVSGADGEAIIKYDEKRVIGGLFSAKTHGIRTLVIITTTDPVPQATIEDILRTLRPISQ